MTKLCKYYQQGRCAYGNACRFSHANPQNNFTNNSQFKNNNNYNNNNYNNNNFNNNNYNKNNNKNYNNNNFNNQNKNSSKKEPSKEQIIESMKLDFTTNAPIWPFSSYGYMSGVPSELKGDISFEELRWKALQDVRQTGSVDSHMAFVNQLAQEMNKKKQDLLQNGPGKVDNTMASLLDTSSTNQPSIFNSQNTTPSIFANQPPLLTPNLLNQNPQSPLQTSVQNPMQQNPTQQNPLQNPLQSVQNPLQTSVQNPIQQSPLQNPLQNLQNPLQTSVQNPIQQNPLQTPTQQNPLQNPIQQNLQNPSQQNPVQQNPTQQNQPNNSQNQNLEQIAREKDLQAFKAPSFTDFIPEFEPPQHLIAQ